MKKTKILYWVFTGLFAAFMLSSAIPDLLVLEDAAKFITDLGYPRYLVAFLGVAKLLGSIAILIPGFPRIREWAYAGLTFDLIGATYSVYCVPMPEGKWYYMVPFLALPLLAYIFYHKKLALTGK